MEKKTTPPQKGKVPAQPESEESLEDMPALVPLPKKQPARPRQKKVPAQPASRELSEESSTSVPPPKRQPAKPRPKKVPVQPASQELSGESLVSVPPPKKQPAKPRPKKVPVQPASMELSEESLVSVPPPKKQPAKPRPKKVPVQPALLELSEESSSSASPPKKQPAIPRPKLVRCQPPSEELSGESSTRVPPPKKQPARPRPRKAPVMPQPDESSEELPGLASPPKKQPVQPRQRKAPAQPRPEKSSAPAPPPKKKLPPRPKPQRLPAQTVPEESTAAPQLPPGAGPKKPPPAKKSKKLPPPPPPLPTPPPPKEALPLPSGWVECQPRGTVICNRFVACKTFVAGEYRKLMPPRKAFNYVTLSESVYRKTCQRVGLVVDLVNTERHYHRRMVDLCDISYRKIACVGYGECPLPKERKWFLGVVYKFIMLNPRMLVCVHCTHGHNRTGFMIVSYLVEVLKYDLESAVKEFARARPPGIFKESYLQELSKIYGRGRTKLQAPPQPKWHIQAMRAAVSFDQLRDKKFMDGLVPGVEMLTDPFEIETIQIMVKSICGWKVDSFPGSQPVSMDVDNARKLMSNVYKVTWKADGQRYMMMIKAAGEVYMLDRDFIIFKVSNLTFPRRKSPKEHVFKTLLDGEMVIDRQQNFSRGRYLVYDAILFEDIAVGKMDFTVRHNCIAMEIIGPRTAQFQMGLLDKVKEPFSLNLKDFWEVSMARSLLDGSFTKKLLHESDGLIFQPEYKPYCSGVCYELLKWKSPENNSVDFLLRLVEMTDGRTAGKLMVSNRDGPYASIELTDQLLQCRDRIIECTWDSDRKAWNFVKVRTDKSFPNSFATAQAVFKSIQNPVTKDRLYGIIDAKFEQAGKVQRQESTQMDQSRFASLKRGREKVEGPRVESARKKARRDAREEEAEEVEEEEQLGEIEELEEEEEEVEDEEDDGGAVEGEGEVVDFMDDEDEDEEEEDDVVEKDALREREEREQEYRYEDDGDESEEIDYNYNDDGGRDEQELHDLQWGSDREDISEEDDDEDIDALIENLEVQEAVHEREMKRQKAAPKKRKRRREEDDDYYDDDDEETTHPAKRAPKRKRKE